MALEDKILEQLKGSKPTYDQLRGQLGVRSGELDEALDRLNRAGEIKCMLGRFHLSNGAAEEKVTVNTNTKICSVCGQEKAGTEFAKVGRQCKVCLAERAKKRYQAAHSAPTRSKAKASAPKRVARKSSTPPLAPGASGPLGILHFNDGVRVGPMHASASGIMQFRAFIDLSGAQLDELFTWWRAARGAA
jgi:hypothetical protein